MPPARAVAVTVACAIVLSACTSTSPGDPPPTERAQAIQRTRSVIGEPAEALGTAVVALGTRIDELVALRDADRIQAVRDAIEDLRHAHDLAAAVELTVDTPDVVAAADAWEAALGASATMADTAEEVLTALAEAVQVDAQLAAIVEGWHERGSRSEVIARFDDAAATADDLADRTGPSTCRGPMQVRAAAAAFVAEASRDLADLVRARDGTGLDQRRAELAEAPYGATDDGEPRRLDAPLTDDGCGALAQVHQEQATVMGALDDLQAALNPADLADG